MTDGAARILRGIDENRSVWANGKPPYEPRSPLSKDESADVAIIGGGFTGVSTALELAKRFPEKRIVLLEARALANGASGRNGGLVLNGIGMHPKTPEQAKRLWDVTQSAMALIADNIAEHRLDVRFDRDGALDVLTDARRADDAAKEIDELFAPAGIPIQFFSSKELVQKKIAIEGAKGAVFDPTAGRLDGLDYVRALGAVVEKLGVAIYEGTPVTRVREGRAIELETPRGTMRAGAIVLATNAYTPKLGYFTRALLPVHSHVIATEARSPEEWAEMGWGARCAGFSDDRDRLAYASMTERGEIVFGGGSNAAYGYTWGGGTSFAGQTSRAFTAVTNCLHSYLPRLKNVPIATRWTGTVALTMSRVATMGVLGEHENVYYALGYSGHGIALANLAGRVIADLYAGERERWRDLPFFEQALFPVPPEPFRFLGYHAYTLLTGRSPRKTLT